MGKESQDAKDQKEIEYLVKNGDRPDLINVILEQRVKDGRPVPAEVLKNALYVCIEQNHLDSALVIYGALRKIDKSLPKKNLKLSDYANRFEKAIEKLSLHQQIDVLEEKKRNPKILMADEMEARLIRSATIGNISSKRKASPKRGLSR